MLARAAKRTSSTASAAGWLIRGNHPGRFGAPGAILTYRGLYGALTMQTLVRKRVHTTGAEWRERSD